MDFWLLVVFPLVSSLEAQLVPDARHHACHPDGPGGLHRQEAKLELNEPQVGTERQRHAHWHAHKVEGC